MYTADTLQGSSGSPAFNKAWELVGVHHGGVPLVRGGQIISRSGEVWNEGLPLTDIQWVANEGARLSKIYAFLASTTMTEPHHQAQLDALLTSASELPRTESVVRNQQTSNRLTEPPSSASGPIQITVNGTANFYLTAPPTQPVQSAEPSPTSVIQRLPGIERRLRFDPQYDRRHGYSETFLDGFTVPAPSARTMRHSKTSRARRSS